MRLKTLRTHFNKKLPAYVSWKAPISTKKTPTGLAFCGREIWSILSGLFKSRAATTLSGLLD
jgi:hypothetical protein